RVTPPPPERTTAPRAPQVKRRIRDIRSVRTARQELTTTFKVVPAPLALMAPSTTSMEHNPATRALRVNRPILRTRSVRSALQEITMTLPVVPAAPAPLATSTTFREPRAAANAVLATTPTAPPPDRQAATSAPTPKTNPTGSGPVGSPVARKKRDMHCTRGLQACPRYAGRGGFECINTRSDPESCGGCRDLDGKGSGSDCTAITGVSVTRCVKGSCVIDSCKKGYTKSLDGSSCVSSSSADGSNPEAFNAQEMGARMKRNSFAKRFARTL
ncbi:hypothetical protein FRC05_001943, partial [Tulasnella sp. 425]